MANRSQQTADGQRTRIAHEDLRRMQIEAQIAQQRSDHTQQKQRQASAPPEAVKYDIRKQSDDAHPGAESIQSIGQG